MFTFFLRKWSRLNYHSKYLLDFSIYYLGLGYFTVKLSSPPAPFPKSLWAILITLTVTTAIIAAFNDKYRQLAFSIMVITPIIRCVGYLMVAIIGAIELDTTVPYEYVLASALVYLGLILNHWHTARRPDYNILVSNVVKKAGSEIPESLKSKIANE